VGQAFRSAADNLREMNILIEKDLIKIIESTGDDDLQDKIQANLKFHLDL